MATSQFKIFTSEDIGGPGTVNGLTGSLIPILDACLVNGYGTKGSAGWSKPAPTSGSVYACYKMPSGSQFCFFVNDNAATNQASGVEAALVGWQYMTSSATAPGATIPTQMVGASGSYGQFPIPSQLLTFGYVICRKSSTATAAARQWIIVADSQTCYMWIATGDVAGTYYHWCFGDFYSLKGVSDLWRCMIYAKFTGGAGGDWTDGVSGGAQTGGGGSTTNQLQVAYPGHFIAASATGTGISITMAKKGDAGISSLGINNGTQQFVLMNGLLASPNPYNNAYYFAPLWVVEPSYAPSIRGRFRGLYQPCHPTSSWSTGQMLSGSGDYSGKIFMIITQGVNGGHWGVEMSPTVETN